MAEYSRGRVSLAADTVYDVAIVGAGPAGLWAAMELAASGMSVILLEAVKRLHDTRNVSNGFMGGSAKSDVQLFIEPGFGGEIKDIAVIEYFLAHLQAHSSSGLKIVKPELSNKQLATILSHQVQIDQPTAILMTADRLINIEHSVRKYLEDNIKFKPNCQLNAINKVRGFFELETSLGQVKAKKCIMALGRGGAHWFKGLTDQLELEVEETAYDLGVRLEFPHQATREYTDKSSVFRLKWDNFRTTAISARGTVEMENVFNIKTSNARSITGKQTHTSSIGLLRRFVDPDPLNKVLNLVQIANILSDGQLLKEPLNKFLSGDSILAPLQEFNELKVGITRLLEIFPLMARQCYVYTPEARLNVLRFKLSKNMETRIKGLYITGDMSGRTNSFVQAACSGLLAAQHIKNS